MRTLSISELRAALSELEDLVRQEGELLITRYGSAIVRVLPVDRHRRIPSRSEFRRSMPKLVSSAGLIREDRNGR